MHAITTTVGALSALALSIAISEPAARADKPKRDTDGNITVYDPSKTIVVHVEPCPGSALGPDYPKCLANLKRKLGGALCKESAAKKLGGKWNFNYRMGAIKTIINAWQEDCSGGSADDAPLDDDTDIAHPDNRSGEEDPDYAAMRGSRGSSGAYWPDGKLIVIEACDRQRSGYDWVSCGRRVRERAKERICRHAGKGLHHYYYRRGDDTPSKTSAYCRE